MNPIESSTKTLIEKATGEIEESEIQLVPCDLREPHPKMSPINELTPCGEHVKKGNEILCYKEQHDSCELLYKKSE